MSSDLSIFPKQSFAGWLMVMFTLCSPAWLSGQAHFQGSFDDVHPFRLYMASGDSTGLLWLGDETDTLRMEGQCALDGNCRFRAVDTSLALRFHRDGQRIQGVMRDGNQSQQSFQASRIAGASPFVQACGEERWLRTWSTAQQSYRITLSALPARQFRGTLYVESFHTSFMLRGKVIEDSIVLQIQGLNGDEIGRWTMSATQAQSKGDSLSAKLDMGAGTRTLLLNLETEMKMLCWQSQGRFDLVFPTDTHSFGAAALEALAMNHWESLQADGSSYGSVWFEPTHLDASLLSGYVFAQGANGIVSQPLNYDRPGARLLREQSLVGSKRKMRQRMSRPFQQSLNTHPLRQDENFKVWAKDQALEEIAIVQEGLLYSTESHPLYGRLLWIEPWSTELVADSLQTASDVLVPAERIMVRDQSTLKNHRRGPWQILQGLPKL